MPALYYVNVTIHLLAAFLWLGGMIFLAAVGAPVLRTVEPPELRQRLFHLLGTKFRAPGWIAIATLLVTVPATLATTTSYSPASLTTADDRANEVVVAPAMAPPFLRH